MTELEALPGRLDALTLQFSQSRVEVRDEFSAVRAEMNALADRVEERLTASEERLTVRFEERLTASEERLTVRFEERLTASEERSTARMQAFDASLEARLIARMDGLGEALTTRMQVLHEDLVSRIALLGEAWNHRARKRTPKSK
jgi:DNA anti-recombination protein RmuC